MNCVDLRQIHLEWKATQGTNAELILKFVKRFRISLCLFDQPTLMQATQQATHYLFKVFRTQTRTYLLGQIAVLIFQVVYPPKKLGNAGYVSLSLQVVSDLLLMLLIFFLFPFCEASVMLRLLVAVSTHLIVSQLSKVARFSSNRLRGLAQDFSGLCKKSADCATIDCFFT